MAMLVIVGGTAKMQHNVNDLSKNIFLNLLCQKAIFFCVVFFFHIFFFFKFNFKNYKNGFKNLQFVTPYKENHKDRLCTSASRGFSLSAPGVISCPSSDS